MSKHTPTPWRTGKTGGTVVSDTNVATGMGHDDVQYYGGHLIAESIQREADAEFIVRACNSHEELLQALKNAESTLNDAIFNIQERRFPAARNIIAAETFKIQAAIAKAERGGE